MARRVPHLGDVGGFNAPASVDVVEVNPILDKHNQTALMAVELVESLFGMSVM